MPLLQDREKEAKVGLDMFPGGPAASFKIKISLVADRGVANGAKVPRPTPMTTREAPKIAVDDLHHLFFIQAPFHIADGEVFIDPLADVDGAIWDGGQLAAWKTRTRIPGRRGITIGVNPLEDVI